MEFPRRPDQASPLHGPEEAEQAEIVAAARPRDPRIRHLERVPLFSGFSGDELRRVAGISRIIEAPAGTVLTQIGDPGDSFFVVVDGTAAVQTRMGVADRLQPNDFFGEMSLIDGEPRSATITATTEVRLLVLDRAHFWRLLDDTPDLTRRVLMVLSRRVRRLEQAANAAQVSGTALAGPRRSAMSHKVRINLANPAELLELPGLGPEQATAIIRFRAEHGPITDVPQLERILGRWRMPDALAAQIDFDPADSTAPEAPGA